MVTKSFVAAVAMFAGTAFLATTWPEPAEAQRRGSTRVTVSKYRSYLDPGTEVLPRSRNYTDYISPPLWSPSQAYDPTGSFRSPLPDTWYLPGYTRGF
jgi:hypothetical protein